MSDVLLLHGFTGSADSWRAVRATLGTDRGRVLAPTLLGHRGAPVPGRERFDDEVERLAEELEARDFRGVLLGYSLGARVALGLLCRAPDRFRAAGLVGVNPGLEHEADRVQRRASDAAWAKLLRQEGLEVFIERWSALPLFATQAGVTADALKRQRDERASHTAEELARSLEVLGLAEMPNYWPKLPMLALPITLFTGARDQKFTQIAQRMRRSLPNASHVCVDGAGHNILVERPDVLTGWLEETRA